MLQVLFMAQNADQAFGMLSDFHELSGLVELVFATPATFEGLRVRHVLVLAISLHLMT